MVVLSLPLREVFNLSYQIFNDAKSNVLDRSLESLIQLVGLLDNF